MCLGPQALESCRDTAILPDDVCNPIDNLQDEQVCHVHVEQPAKLQARVDQEIKGQILFAAEALVRGAGIGAYSEHDRVFARELFVKVAEPARLDGSAGSGILREEVEDNVPAAQKIVQADLFSVLIPCGKSRCVCADGQHKFLRAHGTTAVEVVLPC